MNGTIRHLMCGKIMLGFGGEFGMLKGDKAREVIIPPIVYIDRSNYKYIRSDIDNVKRL